ncbi:hypothetical protein CYMTET_33942, partial [Cymbomonas tetramitiformis]
HLRFNDASSSNWGLWETLLSEYKEKTAAVKEETLHQEAATIPLKIPSSAHSISTAAQTSSCPRARRTSLTPPKRAFPALPLQMPTLLLAPTPRGSADDFQAQSATERAPAPVTLNAWSAPRPASAIVPSQRPQQQQDRAAKQRRAPGRAENAVSLSIDTALARACAGPAAIAFALSIAAEMRGPLHLRPGDDADC